MHDYLCATGYLPVLMLSLEREDYIRMMDQATEGEPDEFICRVADTQTGCDEDVLFSTNVGRGPRKPTTALQPGCINNVECFIWCYLSHCLGGVA